MSLTACGMYVQLKMPPADKTVEAVVPHLCLLNHSPEAHVTTYGSVSNGRLEVRACRPLEQGGSLQLSYGHAPPTAAHVPVLP